MPNPDDTTLLYQALASPIGIRVGGDEFAKIRTRLYAARTAACDPDLDILEFRPSPDASDEVWIVKKGPVPEDLR